MVDKEIVRRRLAQLDEYLGILRRSSSYSYEEFIGDPERYGSAERFLQLSIELVTDIGNHVVSDEGLGEVATYADVPRRLAAAGKIDADLADGWARMIGFRNVLVHEYLEIDRREVHRNLTESLDDFEALKRAFAALL